MKKKTDNSIVEIFIQGKIKAKIEMKQSFSIIDILGSSSGERIHSNCEKIENEQSGPTL